MQGAIYKTLIHAFPGLRWQAPSAAGSLAALLGARALKTTTGIVGLPVDERARDHYREKLEDVLEALKAIPADAAYRVSVEESVNSKLHALASPASDEELEDSFGFQLEQGIKMCGEELKLIPKMAGTLSRAQHNFTGKTNFVYG
jgi:hypothetical protein